MQKMFNQCPACGGQIIITECQCRDCQLQMRGQFRSAGPTILSDDEINFVRVFLAARGNLSEVERVLGISYPTVRNKLDEINAALQPGEDKETAAPDSTDTAPAAPEADDDARKRILQKVADGELAPLEAVEQLRKAAPEGD